MNKCRICKSQDLVKFLQLGPTALANSFLKEDKFDSENEFPLDVYFCRDCFLVQLGEIIPPEIMFKNYLYVSGTSNMMRQHFAEFAKDVLDGISKFDNPLVVDIGSNDGTLLKGFLNSPVKVLGVEPSNIAKVAEENGVETFNDFFNSENAEKIAKTKGKAKAILAANVFAHSPDLDSFMTGVKKLLDSDGIFVVEFPYLVDLLEGMEFDTIYHEHVFYFSVLPLTKLFERFGFQIFDIKKTSVHGGSIRIFVKRNSGKIFSEKVQSFIDREKKLQLNLEETYFEFAKKVEQVKKELLDSLKKLKSDGKKIAGYGAAAKANTLLNYCQIKTDLLDYIVDKNPLKQGLYTPGTHILVVPPEKIKQSKPDYLLILAWNMADEIMNEQKEFQNGGGKFIIPLPKSTIK